MSDAKALKELTRRISAITTEVRNVRGDLGEQKWKLNEFEPAKEAHDLIFQGMQKLQEAQRVLSGLIKE